MFKIEGKKIVCKTNGKITGVDCSTLQNKNCKGCPIFTIMKKKVILKKK